METAISQKIPFLGLIILIFTVITSTQLGVANTIMCYILFFGIRYTLYTCEQCELPATAKGSCHMSRDVWLAEGA